MSERQQGLRLGSLQIRERISSPRSEGIPDEEYSPLPEIDDASAWTTETSLKSDMTLEKLSLSGGEPISLGVRQLEILKLYASGLTQIQIADLLSISKATVKVTLNNIFHKFNVSSRGALVQRATEIGLLSDQSTAESSEQESLRQIADFRMIFDGLKPDFQKAVLLLAKGESNGAVAEQLFMARSTLTTHLSKIYAAFGIRRRGQLYVLAHAAGLLSQEQE